MQSFAARLFESRIQAEPETTYKSLAANAFGDILEKARGKKKAAAAPAEVPGEPVGPHSAPVATPANLSPSPSGDAPQRTFDAQYPHLIHGATYRLERVQGSDTDASMAQEGVFRRSDEWKVRHLRADERDEKGAPLPHADNWTVHNPKERLHRAAYSAFQKVGKNSLETTLSSDPVHPLHTVNTLNHADVILNPVHTSNIRRKNRKGAAQGALTPAKLAMEDYRNSAVNQYTAKDHGEAGAVADQFEHVSEPWARAMDLGTDHRQKAIATEIARDVRYAEHIRLENKAFHLIRKHGWEKYQNDPSTLLTEAQGLSHDSFSHREAPPTLFTEHPEAAGHNPYPLAEGDWNRPAHPLYTAGKTASGRTFGHVLDNPEIKHPGDVAAHLLSTLPTVAQGPKGSLAGVTHLTNNITASAMPLVDRTMTPGTLHHKPELVQKVHDNLPKGAVPTRTASGRVGFKFPGTP